MRSILPALALLLCACTTYPTPRPFSPAVAMGAVAQATPAPDYMATAAVAQAAAEYAVAQTATAQAQAGATATAQMGETVQAVTLQWADVAVQQTQSALTTTAQAVQAAQATGTIRAAWATETATAAGPAATATRAAEVVATDRAGRNWALGWVAGLGTLAAVVIGLVVAGLRWERSQGAIREAEARTRETVAQGQLREAQARAYSLEMAAFKNATQIQTIGRMVLVIVSGEITAAHRLPDETAPRLIEQPPTVPGGNASMVQFIRDAQKAAGVTIATYIPSNARMGRGGGDWDAHVSALKALGIATTQPGRPANGEAGTKLTGDWTLDTLLAALETGRVMVADNPPTAQPQ